MTIQEYKCPACAGAIAFDSKLQKMKCPYCDTEFEMEILKAFDQALKEDLSEDMVWENIDAKEWLEQELEEMSVYVCKSCGGEILVDGTTAATACPYCDNPVVLMGRFSGVLKPSYIIPFKLDKERAKEGFYGHLSGKKLLPKVFKDKSHIDEIKGIYVPFWLFDTQADANIRYKASKVEHYSDDDYNYTKTNFYSIVRAGQVFFENVPVDGSKKMADELMESIEPFNFEEATDFQTAYLAGFLADKYDVDEEKSIERANERIRASVEEAFRATVTGYDELETEHSGIQLKNGKAKYALYPVWLLNTSWNKEKYTFAMNGQTGKFVGNLPIDKSIYWKYFASIAAISGLIIYSLIWLFQ